MSGQLRILMVEDAATDAEIALRSLKRAGIACDARRVETAADFRRQLDEFRPDLVLSDFSMPHFDGMKALAIARVTHPDVPFIFLSGTIGEESAIRALKNGATDYVLKNKPARLPAAVERAIKESRARAEQRRNEQEPAEAREHLSGILTTLKDVVWSIEIPSRRLLYVSPSVSTLYRADEDAFYGDGVLWNGLLHPDDRSRVAAEWEKAVPSGHFDCEHRVVLADGEVRWIHNRGKAAGDGRGRVVRINGISQDITERRRQQQKTARLSRILLKIMRSVAVGRRRISPCLVDLLARGLEKPAERLAHEQLSDRELQIMLLIGSGRSVKQIGGDLSISINTVNTHRARILKKMGMRTNAALIRYTIEHGLVG